MAKSFNDIFESFSSVMELLRNEKFQDLLVNYERAKKVFIVGYDVKDEVSSMVLFEAEDKYGLKPEDYLISFSEFIKQNEKEIEAISIILNKPKDWNTKVLNELKQKLKENKYDESNLQKAHKIVYHKDTVDIISMVKHAVKETEPLLSTDERVNQAIQKVTEGKQLNDEQQKWMEYIKEHLKQNMTLDENDLKELPVFTDRGGFNKFKKVFAGKYEIIINEINKAIAA
ncbi:MAG: type I restriction-modification enzyme R subunit C-terminal domain-containing protein [Bacteroidales bacterium]|jgi:type I restriction enzyme R subunit